MIYQYGPFLVSQKRTKTLPKVVFLQCAKFFNSVRIFGATAQADYVLESVESDDTRMLSAVISLQPGDSDHVSRFFAVQLLVRENYFIPELSLTFKFAGFLPFSTTLLNITESARRSSGRLLMQFNEIIQEDTYCRMLDIGGRARSGILHADKYRSKEVVVIDILQDSGVDIVCDAHRMSDVLDARSFDVVFSNVVFEHLVMPWKVVIEMNRVMRTGAVGLVVSHQTIGMHDMPWDFFRFSDSAWKGLFNKHTGFEIIGTELGDMQYIIPHVYEDRYSHIEKTGGFEYSAVLFRKITETILDWPLKSEDVTSDMYPE